MNAYAHKLDSPIGPLTLVVNADGALTHILFAHQPIPADVSWDADRCSAAATQLREKLMTIVAAAAQHGAARQHGHREQAQKKKAKPTYFHSSTSSLSLRLVKMMLWRYSANRNMKRRVR